MGYKELCKESEFLSISLSMNELFKLVTTHPIGLTNLNLEPRLEKPLRRKDGHDAPRTT